MRTCDCKRYGKTDEEDAGEITDLKAEVFTLVVLFLLIQFFAFIAGSVTRNSGEPESGLTRWCYVFPGYYAGFYATSWLNRPL